MAEIIVPINGGMFDSTEIVETAEGFPRGNKAVDSAFFARMISCFYKNGVWGADSFAPVAAGGMVLKIGAGIAWISGYMAWQKSDTLLTLAAGNAYAVVLRLNVSAGAFTVVAAPMSDSFPTKGEDVFDLVLAEVTVPAGSTTITVDMISDTRGDIDKCGYVTSAVDALSTVDTAQNSNMLGGVAASGYLKVAGGTMSGKLRAASDSSGQSAVRNIGYGTVLPATLADGDLFILIQ